MKNLKISAKLSIAFYTINTIYMLGLIALLLSYMMSNERLNTMNSTAVKPQIYISDVRDAILRERITAERLVLYSPESKEYEEALKNYEKERQNTLEAIEEYINVSQEGFGKEVANEIQEYYKKEYSNFLTEFIRLSENEVHTLAVNWMNESEHIISNMDNKLTNAILSMEEKIDEIISDADFGLKRLIVIAAVMITFVILIIMTILKYMQRTISQKIEELTEAANHLATGGLDINISSDSTDEIGRLTESFLSIAKSVNQQAETLHAISEGNLVVDIDKRSEYDTMNMAIKKMINSLNDMFTHISTSTERVSYGAKQIADGSQTLAQGASEQAFAVEQVSSSIINVTQTTKENFAMAKEASELIDTINNNAVTGSDQMNKMAQAVQEISTASQSINKVIKAIDEIAFQTNILALNAAVEAARAGEHGKGFAVVAGEVRSLASKSAEAAKETGTLIENSMEKAVLGTQISEEAIKSFELIVSGIRKSTGILNEMARLSEQQNTAIDQINQSMDQVAQVVQQNSATAEESAASSVDLSSQSEILEELIAQFKIKSDNTRIHNDLLLEQRNIY